MSLTPASPSPRKLPFPAVRKTLSGLGIFLFVIAGLLPVRSQAQSLVAPPTFSVAHGYFTASFQLTLASATVGAQIHYTTDFSTPTSTNGTLYSGPLTISETTVVRAVAYTSNSDRSPTVTQTYIFLAQVRNQSNTPGGSWPTRFAPNGNDDGPYPAYYEMAPEIVNHATNSSQIEAALSALPSLSLVTDQSNLWDATKGIYVNASQKGSAWERPTSLELIMPNGAPGGFTVNAGVRIHGQASRRPHRTPKKSFRIYFRGVEYGVTKLDYKLFDDNDAVSKFDRILLRNGGNRSFGYFDRDLRRESDYINDEFVRRSYSAMGRLAGHGTYAHLYLNGQYWGLYNVTERMDDTFLIAYFGGVSTDYDLIEPDEDQNYAPVADPGTLDAWNALHKLLDVTTVDAARYQQVQQQLDVVDLADYMILMHYVANTDWPAHNWYTYRKRNGPDTRFHMLPWDADTALNQLNENVTLKDAVSSPARLFLKLMTNADFRQLVADRLYRHLEQSQGVLTPLACTQRYSDLANFVDLAIIGESARWGAYAEKIYPQIKITDPNKALPAYFHSYRMPAADTDPTNDTTEAQRKNWTQVRDAKLSTYCPQRTGVVINQYVQNGWYQTTLKAPTFSQEGGAVAQNYGLTIDNSVNNGNGVIYYTLDGVDPRKAGGAVAQGALDGADLATVTINQVITVRARVFANGAWSPLHEATFYPPQPLSNLVINEIHYHPTAPAPTDPDVFEFIELYNKGTTPLRLDNVYFGRGFTYHFPPSTTLAAGAYFVLSPDAQQFKARYGFDPNGVMRGNLSNGGEAIELRDAVGNVIDSVDYLDLAPWPLAPDGTGPSLALINPELDNAIAANWAPSPANHGTPGQPNGLTVVNQLPQVSITSPAANAIVTVGATVMIQAQATDPDGTIQQVAFFANNTPLCTDTTAPYECSFTPAAGAFSLTAQATDNANAVTTSPAVPMTVNPAAQPPVVNITSPTPNSIFDQGATVVIQAEAGDTDGAVQQVEFLANGNIICTVTTTPYTCSFTPAPGAYTLTARATDSQGLSATTASVAITVNEINNPAPKAPTVRITAPAPDATFAQTATVTMSAEASDSDGVIQKVEFLVDNNVVCTVTTAPYTCAVRPAPGTHTVAVRATDSQGLRTTTATILITVEEGPGGATPRATLYLPLVKRQ